MDILNKDIFRDDRKEFLKKEFLNNHPFKHVVIKNFLVNSKAKELLDSLKKETFYEKNSDLFHFNQTQDLEHSKNPKIKEFFNLMNSKELHKFLFSITNINVSKNADMFGSLYQNTDFLLCHDDKLLGRKIAYIFYLSKDFKEKEGGSLNLIKESDGKPSIPSKKYIPSWNSLLMFEVSAKSYHEVEEVLSDKKRYAIGGWFH